MDLSIIIVSWNVKDKLRECLMSVEETMATPRDHATAESGLVTPAALTYEVFVVDNASKDGSVQMVEKEFPEAHLIANNFNAGFAKANNQAIRLSQGRYVLLLNPDMRLLGGGEQAHTLQGMVRFMDEERNRKVGVAGCWLVNAAGETVPHVRRFPTIKDQLAVLLKVPHLFPVVLNLYMMKDFDYSKEARVDSIRGSFFMIRREVLDKIGLLDEGFFIWFEEVDFCKRAIEAGFEVAYTPRARCVDYVGQSFRQVRLYPKQKMMTRSMLYYFKKHHPWWQYRILWILRPLALAAAWVGDSLHMQAKRVT
ncbi:MAG: Glycosyl transferase family 2 [Parcubacteria group bacterium GW2011_GWC2_45_7]|nr:MAG: Glycosyl transferase family 2 [Parcubacteria group bacterium GW2011_GWC2_45_7]KKU73697.1 MAG: Glycosyl transferase family 2 [Parcubacteria group bacterium GW2011_GWA2_47_26]